MSLNKTPWIPLLVAVAASVGAARVADADDKDKNEIKKVDFTDEGQSTTIHIRGTATPTFTVYKLERPNRVVIDVSSAELGSAVEKAQENGATIAVGSWAVSQVAAYELDDGGELVRVVVTLAHPGRYDVEANGNELVVTVVARDPAPEKVDAEDLAAAKEAAEQAKKDSESAKTAKKKAEGDAAKAKEQADAAKAEAKKAKQALADAEAKSSKADKASKADKKRAAEELAAAKAEAERAAKALAAAQKDADKTSKAVATAKAEAERTREAAELAKKQAETMAAELEAVKAEAKAAKDAAKIAKDAAKIAKDNEKQAKDAEKAAKNAEQEAKDATKAAKADAKKHARDADDARSDADAAQKDADAARSDADRAKAEAAREKKEAAQQKQEAAAAKAEAEQQKQEAAAAKAEAELQKKEAVAAKAEAAQQKKEAAAAKAEAAAMKKATAEAEADAERLAAEAETARADAKRARSDADVAQADAKKKKKAADAAEKEARAQREAAELARAEAAEHERGAEAMRKEAEAMRDEARARLAEAEAEAKAAKQSKDDAIAALKKAETRETKAREAEDTAAAERKAAKEALAAAEKAKKEGDADADQKMKDAEARLAKAEKARVKAEDQRIAAEQAAEGARDEAKRRKAESAEAVAARTAAETDKKAAEDAATEAKASAKRAEELRVAEAEAATKAAEAKLAAEDAERAKASKKDIEAKKAEAEKLEKLAKKATKKRAAEEAELASIVELRRQAEAELDEAKVARAEAEDATKKAEEATKKAKKAKAEAEAEAAIAKQDAEAARKEAEVARKDADDAKAAKKKKTTTTKKKAEPKQPKVVAVKDVEFEQDGDDSRVIVSMGGKVDAEVVQADAHSAELLLTGAELPDKLQRKLDVRKFDGAVRAISTFRDPDDATKVRVVVELSGEASPRLERVGEDLHWHFDGAGATAQVKKTKKKSKKTTHKTQDIPAPVVGGYGATSSPVTSTSVAQSGGGKRRVYHGPAIDLDFKDADIHNLLRFLANIGRVSIVVPDDIKATVTVRLKKVPWDQALEVILESKGLWYRKTGNLYRIDSRTVLDEEDQKEAERVRAAIQAEAPEAEVFTLNYASAKDTAAKLEPLLSPKGRIEVDSRTNSLIINDIKAHRRRVIDLAARLDTQTPQIMIEARIVEARSTYAREFGIQWGGSANASQAGGNATGLLFPNSIGVAGGADDRVTPGGGVATPTDFAVNLPATVGTGLGGALGVSLGSVGGNFNINLRLSAAEDQGTVRIISQPKITVLNNTEAEISQGVSIPISVVSAQGTQTQFVPADLALTVTPYVSQRDCSVAMDVKVTKNEPDFVNTGARGDPTILRKEAHTKILVADGETTVMGGITTRNSGLAYNKVPFFGDLPVIGWFFKHRSENDDRTELLIFITPTITNRGFLTCE